MKNWVWKDEDYSSLPTTPDGTELDEVVSDVSRAPSFMSDVSSLQSSFNSFVIRDGKRYDKRKERVNTELLSAVYKNNVPAVKRLLEECGASPNATCRKTLVSVAHLAAAFGYGEILKVLVEFKCNLLQRDKKGRQPVHFAAWQGHKEILQIIWEARGDYEIKLLEETMQPEKERRELAGCLDLWSHNHHEASPPGPENVPTDCTPLHFACRRLQEDCVGFLLECGVKNDPTDEIGLTPLESISLSADGADESLHSTLSTSGNTTTENIWHSMKAIDRIALILFTNGVALPKTPVLAKKIPQMLDTSLNKAVRGENIPLMIKFLNMSPEYVRRWNKDGDTVIHEAIKYRLEASLKALLEWGRHRNIIDLRNSKDLTPLHLATTINWPTGVSLLLEANADVTLTTVDRSNVLHLAAKVGNPDMLRELLAVPDATLDRVLEKLNENLHSPLSVAVKEDNLECVKCLVEVDACAHIKDSSNETLLHLAARNNSPEMLQFLLEGKADAKSMLNNLNSEKKGRGLSALHIAAANGFADCVQVLLKARADVFVKTIVTESTALHLAAAKGHKETLQVLLDVPGRVTCKKQLLTVNKAGHYPLHVAASCGHGSCVKEMLLRGASLAEKIPDGFGEASAISVILAHVPQPIDFIEEVFDDQVEVNEFPLNDPNCVITLRYDLLVPKVSKACNCKQLLVLDALLNTGNRALQERLLLHPVPYTFLYLIWKRLRFFFFVMLILQSLLTASITVFAHLTHVENDLQTYGDLVLVARIFIVIVLFFTILLELLRSLQRQAYYFKDIETYLKWIQMTCAILMVSLDPDYVISRNLSSITVLLSWIELLFLMSRSPTWGYYIHMFITVAKKISKVLLSFSFLIVGFTFFFLIHFEAAEPFRNWLESFTKVVVMMNEFDYENMFSEAKELNTFSVVGRLVFLVFLLCFPVVLMNLLVGLSVSDISRLEAQGKTERLAKQIDFLSLLDVAICHDDCRSLIPKKLGAYLRDLRHVPKTVTIRPVLFPSTEKPLFPKKQREKVIEQISQMMLKKQFSDIPDSIIKNSLLSHYVGFKNQLNSLRSNS